MMNFLDFLFDALSVFHLSGRGSEDKADIDPINKKLNLISLILIMISVLLIYFFKTEIFQIENLIRTLLWSFAVSILLSLILFLFFHNFKIIHSLVISSFILTSISASVFLSMIILLFKI